MSRTFALTIAYDGTDFAGWQIQPQQETIQGNLQKAVLRATGHNVTVTGSGRTDAGVHALAQVASVRFPQWTASPDALCKAINSRLGDSVVVTRAQEAPPDFHAIRDCIGKRYRYQIQVRGQRDPFGQREICERASRLRFADEPSRERLEVLVRETRGTRVPLTLCRNAAHAREGGGLDALQHAVSRGQRHADEYECVNDE